MSIQYTIRPRAQTSVAGPMTAPGSVCSGAIHIGVPMAEVVVLGTASERIFEMPKSSTLRVKGVPSLRASERKTFSGFRSRCTTPTW